MATGTLFVLCLLAFNYANCLSDDYIKIDNPDAEVADLKQFVLDTFNANKEAAYDYNEAHILDAQKRDGPEKNYFMLLDISVSCKKDSECNTKNLVCEVIVKEDFSTGKKEISEDNSVCVKKLPPSMSMINKGGFVEESVSEEVQRVAELAVEQLENEGDTKRTIFEIISVKTQDNSDGKKLFLTLKVAKPIDDAVDMTEFETCEIEVSMNDPLVVENSTSCFPISEGQTDYSMSEDDMNEEAKKALNEINNLSSSPFQQVLVKVVTADRSVTPGSQGSVTTIQFQVAPSLCLKNGGGDRESPVERNCPPMSSAESQAPLQCTLTAWERPWHPSASTLYSGPICHTDKSDGVSEEEATSKSVSDLSEDMSTTVEPIIVEEEAFCTGCLTDIDVESESVRALAQEVLTSMETPFAHRLVRVVKAQKQVINGIRYVMTLEVVRTACPPEAARIDLNGCPEIDGEEDGGVRTCHIEVVERPWTDSAREVIVNDCSGESPATRKDGTIVQASPDSTSVPQGEDSDLNEVVQAFDEMFGDDPQVLVPEVGLYDGSSDFVESTNDVPVIALLHRERRGTMPGGLRDVLATERDKVLKYARFALESMDALDEDMYKRVLEDVVSAHKQTVNGYKYHLSLKVSTSNCVESQSLRDCASHESTKKHYLCKAQVHVPSNPSQPLRLLTSECSPVKEQSRQHRNRRGIPGGKFDAAVDDPYIQSMSNIAVDHLSSQSTGTYKKTLVRILEAKKQIVSGLLVHLTLEIGDTTCEKDTEADGDCPLQDDAGTQICHAEVWDRQWLKKTIVTNFTCEEKTSESRKKRELGNENQELFSELFSNFLEKYNKKYSSDEERRLRFRIFRANMRKVKALQETEQGTATYGATQFADLSAKEFKKMYLGYNPHARKLDLPMKMAEIPEVKLPKEFDWRHYNVVTEVKNQGMCGSCWAFSVTGNVEGQYALHHDKLISLSEQELVDCDTLDQGCNGGLMDQAYHAIENIGGFEDEDDYPYEGYKDKCHFKEAEAKVTLSGSLNISSSEDAMAKWLFKNGPISIALNANAMQFYFGGVSHPWKVLCDPEDLDHGVLIVGFGVHRTTFLHRTLPYWIIKNSWGPSWGEQGYYRIYRGDGTCGVNKMASSAIVN